MSAQENLWKLKAGYAAWNDRLGDSLDVWREMIRWLTRPSPRLRGGPSMTTSRGFRLTENQSSR